MLSAWEQWTTFEYFRRNAGAPKVLIVGIDDAWCDPNADRDRARHGFPAWMYDDDRWNDYANLFNSGTLELAGASSAITSGSIARAAAMTASRSLRRPRATTIRHARVSASGSGGPRSRCRTCRRQLSRMTRSAH
jgi:hypothetical protein